MIKRKINFSVSSTDFYFNGSFSRIKTICAKEKTVLLTDENIYRHHKARFRGWNTIVLKAGEDFKIQETADAVIKQLIDMQMDRQSTLVGIGGGVITDIAGYVAAIYLRGIRSGFIPTTILGLADASIGGKNGIDVGEYKNMVGTIRQPAFILHDASLLQTLPLKEWSNGFAEIIKHACITDKKMFSVLEKNDLVYFQKNKKAIETLIHKNVMIKSRIVQKDEFEKGERRLLNFGHTIGHALETQYELMHGEAISIGMVLACRISEQITGFSDTDKVSSLLEQYRLPVHASFDPGKVFNILRMDKKRERKEINFILLKEIGKAVIKSVSLTDLEKFLVKLAN